MQENHGGQSTRIKICGLTGEQDILTVNEISPDYAGFVFAPSKRRITEDKAAGLRKLLNPEIQTVGVFVNETIETIIRLCEKGVIDLVQLHGDETENYIMELKERISSPVIKAIRVKSPQDIRLAERLPCEYLLLDTYREGEYGGSGKSFDWAMIPEINKPFFLAGGLNAECVQCAIEHIRPYGVDVSSGVESNGRKDPVKMMEFVRAAKATVFER